MTCAVGLAVHAKENVKAYEIVGSALDPHAILTKRMLTVAILLEPLSREQGARGTWKILRFSLNLACSQASEMFGPELC